MNIKKPLAATLLGIFLSMNGMPCLAINNTDKNSSKADKKFEYRNKNGRQNDAEYKYEYVNIDWWKSFNDGYLQDYIVRAIQHNHDLKMASIAVDEYYQYTKIQFASELPTVGGAFSPAFVKQMNK
ncbi:MAG: hypothetical protein Q4E87_09100, partial [bacterium]|nr:hypothetical protein [bacterium]